MVCILIKLILNSGDLVKKTYILGVFEDKGIKELGGA
jgi:hypothetical protein